MTSLGTIIGRGATGSRPAAGTPGALYFDTTRSVMQRDNGSTWDDVEGTGGGGGGSLEVTDGTTDLTSVTKITVTDLLVGGTAGASTLKPSLSNASASLSADVTMTTANTYYDGPSVSLAAGTWLLTASVFIQHVTAAGWAAAKLWDGTTAVDSAAAWQSQANGGESLPLVGIVSPTGTTTYKVSATGGQNGYKMCANLSSAGFTSAGNNLSTIVAVRIG